MLKSGVYQITGPTRKVYVGSAENFEVRFKRHKSELRGGKHHCIYLQRAWDKHGAEAFRFEPLMYFESLDLKAAEQSVLDKLWDTGTLYNMAKDAKAPMRGRKHSPETMAKLIGRKASEETKRKLSIAHLGNSSALGVKHTTESRANMKVAQANNRYWLGKKRGIVLSAKVSFKNSLNGEVKRFNLQKRLNLEGVI